MSGSLSVAERLPPPGGAIVIGGDRMGLGVVRSLGRHKIPVWVLADDHLIATTSRYAGRTLRWPRGCDERKLEMLLDLARRPELAGWLVFATSDEDAALLARNHARLSERLRLTTPPWEVLRWGYDKRLTDQLVTELRIDHPRTLYPRDREEVAALDCDFPVILKPAVKQTINRFTHAKAWRADNRRQLLARYDQARALIDPSLIMVQELIPGDGEAQFSYAALCQDGRPLAWVTANRVRQYPLDFGYSSSFVETIDDPEVEQVSRRLLAAMCYSGLAEVELKRDRRDGRLKLLEINPRLWGWHTLGARAGVDFPYLTFQLFSGEPIAETAARAGVRWVRLLTDLPAVALGLRRGSLSLGTYLSSFRWPLECAVLAADDPLPALLEVPLLCYIEWKTRGVRARPAEQSTVDGLADEGGVGWA